MSFHVCIAFTHHGNVDTVLDHLYWRISTAILHACIAVSGLRHVASDFPQTHCLVRFKNVEHPDKDASSSRFIFAMFPCLMFCCGTREWNRLVASFVRRFVCMFVRVIRTYTRADVCFFRSFICTYIRTYGRTYVRTDVHKFGRMEIRRSFVGTYARADERTG